MGGDILEIELQLLKDKSTKSIKTTLKNGEEIILYSPYYVKLLENENKQLQQENKQLKEDKKKAKEYIKENEFYLDYKTGACIKGVMPLLKILGGKSE